MVRIVSNTGKPVEYLEPSPLLHVPTACVLYLHTLHVVLQWVGREVVRCGVQDGVQDMLPGVGGGWVFDGVDDGCVLYAHFFLSLSLPQTHTHTYTYTHT